MQFKSVRGTIRLLDVEGKQVGDSQLCLFWWEISSKGWAVGLTKAVTFEFTATESVSYAEIEGGREEIMFRLPVLGRPRTVGSMIIPASPPPWA